MKILATCLLLVAVALGLHAQCVLTIRPDSTAGKDAYVFGMSCSSSWALTNGTCETTNFGNRPNAFASAWTWWGTPGTLRTFMEFDLDSLANAGCSVSNAKLSLRAEPGYFEYTCGQGNTLHPCNDNSLLVSRVTQSWDENLVNWLTQPPVANTLPGIDYFSANNTSDPYPMYELDMTDMVNFWLSNPSQNYGFRLALLTEAVYSRVTFASSDHSNAALRPTLELTLNCPGSCDRLIEGDVYFDQDANCNFGAGDQKLANWLVEIQPGPMYATTDATGHWTAWVGNASSYNVKQLIPNHVLWDSICPLPYEYVLSGLNSGSVTSNLDFAVDADIFCAQPSVDIVSGFLRPCHVSPYSVQYCNNGNDTLYNAVVTVERDPMVDFLASSLPWNLPQSGFIYEFPVGNLGPGQCGSFYINGQVNCNAQIGQSICVTAEISPLDSCVFTPIDSTWDRSSVMVDGDCVGDSLACFTITNTGSASNGNMLAPSQYRIYDNGVLVYSGTFQLCGGCDTTICWPANGHTIRLEADQRPGHPGNSHPNDNVEGCGSTSTGQVFRGFVTGMEEDDEDDHIEVYCGVVVNSYDPNDKQVAPAGLGNQHLTNPGAEMEYVIRFQNTGTAAAIDVVLLDTLSQLLDVVSVQPGASSHPYTWQLKGSGVLEFAFMGINLPDSFSNEPASHGFVKFKLNQAPGIPLGSRIENRAAIYFDNNAPVLTNTTFNTIGLETAAVKPNQGQDAWMRLSPNPVSDQMQLDWSSMKGEGKLEIIDLAGRVMLEMPLNLGLGTAKIDLPAMPSAVYLVKISSGKRVACLRMLKE